METATSVTLRTSTDAVTAQRLVQTAVELADPDDGDWDITDALYALALRCVELLGVDAAGVLLADEHGKLNTVASSHEDTRLLELFQLQTDEGPCVDCFRQGRSVSSSDLDGDGDRWPAFTERARRHGLSSVHAVPMRLGGTVIGALNLFRCAPGALDDAQLAIAASFATATTIAIQHRRAQRSKDRLAEQLQHALDSRVLIEQAKGYLARRHGERLDQAFVRLRTYARAHNTRLVAVARRVIAGELDLA
jgi:GAF domain-containing protein